MSFRLPGHGSMKRKRIPIPTTDDTPTLPKRADARRNRERLLAAARLLFAERGADVSLAAVAREAGVGVGTAYRHFPTQEELVQAVYRDEVTRICDAATRLAAELPPADALGAWLHECVDFVAAKKGMSEALQAASAAAPDVEPDSRGRILAALAGLLAPAQADGAVRADVDAEDVAATLGGVYLALDEPARAHRVVDLIIDGLRVPAPE